ncbi:MAG: mechanosensitive ion channel family protein [Rickettsiales bacterium]|jgi:miniconductance mechanosensitive channel|nr:mechanosensitive ion channel family protein [Rickettsiales bacterium]
MVDIFSMVYKEYALAMKNFPWLVTLTEVILLILFAWAVNRIFEKIILKIAKRNIPTEAIQKKSLNIHEIILHFIKIVPLAIIIWGAKVIPGLPDVLEKIIDNVARSLVLLIIAITLSSILDVLNVIYRNKFGRKAHSIKGYIQLVKLIISIITTILIIAELINRSPVILLSGLGAMAAVLMLVFQDTLLSFVASIQISSGDLIRVGDWVEMPSLNADGEVIDIALHTVKVQNWDNTITILPTRKFITDPFKNWRAMEESGGRRIKRVLNLNQNTVRCLSKDEIQNLKKINFLKEYFSQKQPKGSLGILNVAAFCEYTKKYLKSNTGIHQDMTILVRQVSTQGQGLPIEIYCFTNNTGWVAHEDIQAEIFNHLFTVLPEFGLEVFQKPSGADFRNFINPQPKSS